MSERLRPLWAHGVMAVGGGPALILALVPPFHGRGPLLALAVAWMGHIFAVMLGLVLVTSTD